MPNAADTNQSLRLSSAARIPMSRFQQQAVAALRLCSIYQWFRTMAFDATIVNYYSPRGGAASQPVINTRSR
jgi:hypothetical protein